MKKIFKGILFACFVGLGVAFLALLQIGFDFNSLSETFKFMISFGCLGFLLGGIYAFDSESKEQPISNTFIRIATGIFSAIVFSFMWKFNSEEVTLAVLVCGSLSYFGLSWAKHVDF